MIFIFWLNFRTNYIKIKTSNAFYSRYKGVEFLGKIVFVLLFIPRFEYNAVILCEPVIWCFMTLELLIAYRHNSFVFPKKK